MDRPRSYLFDVKLLASVRVTAETQAQARYWLDEHLFGATANLGSWIEGPDIGQPIWAEVSQDGVADLVEIDGEPA
jgi:hypothetical protein